MRFESQKTSDQSLAVLLAVLGMLFRLAPHPENFTPTMAIALFSGVTLPPALALIVPLLVMMATDLVIGLHSLYWLVWASFAAVVLIGVRIRHSNGFFPIGAAAFSGSLIFFLTTNLGVFLFENMYPRTWQGLRECFVMAVPFFRNSLAGDMFYTVVFFSLFAGAQWMRQPKKAS